MKFEEILLKNTFRNLKKYIYYLVTSTSSVFAYFIFSVILNHPKIYEKQYRIVKDEILSFREALFIISIFFVLYSLKNFMLLRKKEFGIFKTIGMDKRAFYKIIIIENIIIGGLSILLGIILGIIFSKFFLIIFSSMLEGPEMNFYFSIKVIKEVVIRYGILFIIVPFIASRRIIKSTPYSLLFPHYNNNEKTKLYKIFSILAFLFILSIIIYINKFTQKDTDIFFIKFILLILINYIFLKSILLICLNFIKDIKIVYLNKNNMLFLSGITRKINNMISLIILSTFLLTFSFVLLSLAYIEINILKKELNIAVPYTYSIVLKDNTNYENVQKSIENIFNNKNFKYVKDEFKLLMTNGENNIIFIKSSDYNSLLISKDKKQLSLKKNEIAFINKGIQSIDKNNIKESYIYINDIKLKITDIIRSNIDYSLPIGDIYIISEELYKELEEQYKTSYYMGYEVENWEQLSKINEDIYNNIKKYSLDDNIDITSRLSRYIAQRNSSNMTIYFGGFISVLLYFMTLSLIHFKFYNDTLLDRDRYEGLMSIGLTKKELKKLITKEMYFIFFLPYTISFINTKIVIELFKESFTTDINVYLNMILIIIFVINLVYFLVWKYKSLDELMFNINMNTISKVEN